MTSDSRIAVAFLLSSLRFGGAENHTLQLCQRLDRDSFRTGLAYLKREEHLLPAEGSLRRSLWCADIPKGWDSRGFWRLRRWLRGFRPDLLVCVNTYPLFYGHLTRFFGACRCPLVTVFHTTELPADQETRMRLVFRPLLNRSDRIVYVSEAQRRYWQARGVRPQIGHCIHNGIDTEHYRDTFTTADKARLRARYGFADTDFVVGICAGLRPEKRHDDLLRALAELKKRGISAKGLIIGGGQMRADIANWIAELDLRADAVITGFQTDVRPFVAACDCMAIVSHQVETFSIAALESMAMGKPMVMSNIGGAAEQVVHGQNGFLFERGDIPALVAALARLSDADVRARAAEAARRTVVAQFNEGSMIAAYAKFFAEASRKTRAYAGRPEPNNPLS